MISQLSAACSFTMQKMCKERRWHKDKGVNVEGSIKKARKSAVRMRQWMPFCVIVLFFGLKFANVSLDPSSRIIRSWGVKYPSYAIYCIGSWERERDSSLI